VTWIHEDSLKSWQTVVDQDRLSRSAHRDYAQFGREVIPTLLNEVRALHTHRRELGQRVAKCDALASENDDLKWAFDKYHKTLEILRLVQADNERLRLALEQVGPANERTPGE
jgi:hypothetical protein